MYISILISSYNKGNYLEDCIQSCLSQDSNNFEIILLDNFSTDKTELVLKKYKNKIKIFRNKRVSSHPCINQIDQLVKGFNYSSGEVICLLDADDMFYNNKISEIRNFFINNQSIEVVFDLPTVQSLQSFSKFNNTAKIQNTVWPTIIPTSSISIRKKLFKECINIGLFSGYNILEIDFRINVYARVLKNNFHILDSSLNIYRQVEGSIMSSHKKYSKFWWERRLQAHQFMKKWFSKKNQSYTTIDYLFTKIIVNMFNLKNLFT